MELEVKLVRKDFENFVLDSMKYGALNKTRQNFIMNNIFHIILFLVIFVFIVMTDFKINIPNLIFGWIIGCVSVIAVIAEMNKNRKRLFPAENGFLYRQKTYRFSSEGYQDSGENYESKKNWAIVKNLYETKNCYYFFIDNGFADIIPKRCLDPERVEQFEGEIKKHLADRWIVAK